MRCPHCGEDAELNAQVRGWTRRLIGGLETIFGAFDRSPDKRLRQVAAKGRADAAEGLAPLERAEGVQV